MINDLNLVLAMKLEEDMSAEELSIKQQIDAINSSLEGNTDFEQRSQLSVERNQLLQQLYSLISAE